MLLCAQHVLPVSSAPIENGAVLVKDGKIADIGKADMLRIRMRKKRCAISAPPLSALA